MMSSRPLLILVCLIVVVVVSAQSNNSCDQCRFGGNDAADCKVYGQIDGTLVAWTRASSDCLDAFNIKIASIDPASVGCNTNPVNVNTFVNAIRFQTIPNSVLGGLGGDNDFFVQDAAGIYSLNDSIVVAGQSYDCQTSESDCYTALKTYFESTTGAAEMADVCDTVIDQVLVDRELEQSTVRIRLCREEEEETSPESATACQVLADQVAAKNDELPNTECSGFGFGPDPIAIPGCDDDDDGRTTTTGGTSTGGIPTTPTSGATMMTTLGFSPAMMCLVPAFLCMALVSSLALTT
jgi:hypothetical protein